MIRGHCMSNFVICSSYTSTWQKVRLRSIVGRVHMGHNLGSYQGCAKYVPSDMRSCLFEYHISLCSIFALKEVLGHYFWAHLKMFIVIFDLLVCILNNGTVNGKMRSYVALMPMVIKFGPSD